MGASCCSGRDSDKVNLSRGPALDAGFSESGDGFLETVNEPIVDAGTKATTRKGVPPARTSQSLLKKLGAGCCGADAPGQKPMDSGKPMAPTSPPLDDAPEPGLPKAAAGAA
mmetsp:Transcript_21948/g.61351  ORF Transcript_21948/g.61351 Transcript_21948/m.61351 type:complete len:112 (+) Transcript_21948:100-435(+)